ncbi:hypothetical protein SALBM311S_05506 [Streptomyces alboniger]
MPLYRDLPSPDAVSMVLQASIWVPVPASVRTVRAAGLPRESCATAFVRHASFGVPCRVSTTSCDLAVILRRVSPRLAARSAFTARSAAFGADSFGVTLASEITPFVARSALR